MALPQNPVSTEEATELIDKHTSLLSNESNNEIVCQLSNNIWDAANEALPAQIQQINDQIDELVEQANALDVHVLDVSEASLVEYIETVLLLEQQDVEPTAYIMYGPDFGVDTLRDWAIGFDGTAESFVELLNGNDPGLDNTVLTFYNSFDYTYDLLYSELGFDGTYGIIANINKLNQVKSIVTNDLLKFSTVWKVTDFCEE